MRGYTEANYDAWLERPYQSRERRSDALEDYYELVGERVRTPEGVGVVTDVESWEDADEDGRYGGVDVMVRDDLSGTVHGWPVSEIKVL